MSFDQNDTVDDEEDDDVSVENTFLTFQVNGEEYALGVEHVTEIVRIQKTFAIPDVPPYVRGVINLRGKIIPLLDVRSRFGFNPTEYTDRTVVIVLDVADALTGLIVDGVSEVAEIPPQCIEPRPELKNQAEPALVQGVGKRGNNVSFILEVGTLLGSIPSAVIARAALPATPGES